MAAEGAMAVQGGNWQIFHKMVERSSAIVCLNTSVVALDLSERKPGGTTRPQYIIRTKSPASEQGGVTYPVDFDDVVIANPWQFSGIEVGENVIQDPIDEIPYVQLHVTIFSSPYRYSPRFFGLTELKDVPGTILTTLSASNETMEGEQGAGKAGFFSISILRKAVNPKTGEQEYIYKIFSPQQVTPEFLRCDAVASSHTWAFQLTFLVAACLESRCRTILLARMADLNPSVRSHGTILTFSTRTRRRFRA